MTMAKAIYWIRSVRKHKTKILKQTPNFFSICLKIIGEKFAAKWAVKRFSGSVQIVKAIFFEVRISKAANGPKNKHNISILFLIYQ